MFASRFFLAAVLLASLGVAIAVRAAEPQSEKAPAEKPQPSVLGQKLDDFNLADIYGKKHRLADYADQKLVVLAFLGAECPRARLYAPRLAELAKKYQAAGVAILGVNSNAQDNITELKNRDYFLLQGLFLFIIIGVLIANFIVDIAYVIVDPRTRAGIQGS
jgi:thiol-disulfide isomerase/thioredoxin